MMWTMSKEKLSSDNSSIIKSSLQESSLNSKSKDFVHSDSHFTSDFRVMLQIVFWNGLGMFYMEFLVPYIATSVLSVTKLQIGALVSFQVFGYLISTFIAGILTDRNSKTKIVLVGSFGRGIAYLFFYGAILAKSYALIGTSTFILGFGAGFFWVPFNTMISEKSSPDRRSNAFGRRSSALGFGIMVGSLLGFWVFFETINTEISPFIVFSPLIVFASANIYAGFQFLLKVDENLKYNPCKIENIPIEKNNLQESEKIVSTSLNSKLIESNENIQPDRETWSSQLKSGFLFIMIVLVLASINSSIGRPFVQVYFLEYVNSDPNTVLLIYIPGGIFQMLLAAKMGALADRIPPKVSITISSVAGAIITYFLVNTSSLWLIALLWMLDNTIISLGFLTIQNLLSRTSYKYRGKILGSQETITNLGGLLGPIIGGLAYDNLGAKSPFYISVGAELLLIPFYLIALHWLLPHLLEKTSEEKLNLSKK